ncbi:hypothetical protein LEP1GSC187_0668 [Leptospira santarosai str. ZUN179]|uniref:Uncharacterized protein n=1 Tax=Leptospira santarosai str. ZUN179 TaxID=1049985 RepID=M6UTQ3_9LEPT|nr:hypothetical protein LEP1GSC187_0668 [Leptospira santarosai str. ZUN179]
MEVAALILWGSDIRETPIFLRRTHVKYYGKSIISSFKIT